MNNLNVKANSDYAFNYTEHLVKKQKDSKTVMARVGIIFLATVLFLGIFFLMFKIPQIAVFAVVMAIYVCILLWNLTLIEYEYVIASGEMSVDKIVAERRRRRITEFKIPTAEFIAPYSEVKLSEGTKVFMAVSSPTAEDAYCVTFIDESGEKTALVFNATDKALDMLKYYNRKAFLK